MSRLASHTPLLHLKGVSKRFGSLRALDQVDLEVEAGEFLVLFGPNGAGKTTLLRIAAGLMQPTSGRVRFAGSGEVGETCGYVSHQSLLYNELTGLENLLFYARLHGLPEADGRAQQALERMGLPQAAGRLVRGYSRGMKQRLTLARALLHEPELLLLDEPYTGLDRHGCRLLTRLLGECVGRRTVILVTHSLAEGLDLASRVLIQKRGRLVYQAPARDLDLGRFEATYLEVVEGRRQAENGGGVGEQG